MTALKDEQILWRIALRWLLSTLLGAALGFFIGLLIGTAVDSHHIPGGDDDMWMPGGEIYGPWLGLLMGAFLGALFAFFWGQRSRKMMGVGEHSQPQMGSWY